MKRFLAVGLASVLAMPVFSTVVVYAHEGTDDAKPTVAQTTTTQSDDSDDTAKPTAEQLQEIQSRIAKRKTELKTKLTAAEKTRLTSKCQASQGLISSVRGRIKGIQTSRTEVYGNLIDHLTELSEKLKNKGVDTTEFDADIATLKTKVETFNTDLATYKQAVSDLVNMDCKSDPDGFKASLEAARAALKVVQTDAQAIRSYATDTIKPLLVSIRAQLEKEDSTDSDDQPAAGGTQ